MLLIICINIRSNYGLDMKIFQLCLFIFVTTYSFSSMQRFQKAEKSCELVDQTLVIVKPEAVMDQHIGQILEEFEGENLSIIGMKMKKLSQEEAEKFYEIHKKKNFYSDLTKYMSSGPVVLCVLEGRDAVVKVRKLIGETNPQAAQKGTIREKYGQTLQKNAVHSSDSVKSAKKEITFFFTQNELFSPCARIVFKN